MIAMMASPGATTWAAKGTPPCDLRLTTIAPMVTSTARTCRVLRQRVVAAHSEGCGSRAPRASHLRSAREPRLVVGQVVMKHSQRHLHFPTAHCTLEGKTRYLALRLRARAGDQGRHEVPILINSLHYLVRLKTQHVRI